MITLKDIYKIYHNGDTETRAADGINLHIDKGEFVAIVGQSGSGKSTIMNIIGCLDTPTSGTYELNGIDVSTMDDDELAEIRNVTLGFIFQQYNLIPKLTILENVELPLLYAGIDKHERREKARAMLEQAAGLGILPVPATGRMLTFLPPCLTELPFLRYAITSNGAGVYDLLSGRCLYNNPIPPDRAA